MSSVSAAAASRTGQAQSALVRPWSMVDGAGIQGPTPRRRRIDGAGPQGLGFVPVSAPMPPPLGAAIPAVAPAGGWGSTQPWVVNFVTHPRLPTAAPPALKFKDWHERKNDTKLDPRFRTLREMQRSGQSGQGVQKPPPRRRPHPAHFQGPGLPAWQFPHGQPTLPVGPGLIPAPPAGVSAWQVSQPPLSQYALPVWPGLVPAQSFHSGSSARQVTLPPQGQYVSPVWQTSAPAQLPHFPAEQYHLPSLPPQAQHASMTWPAPFQYGDPDPDWNLLAGWDLKQNELAPANDTNAAGQFVGGQRISPRRELAGQLGNIDLDENSPPLPLPAKPAAP